MINTHARARVTRFVEETHRPSVRPPSVGRRRVRRARLAKVELLKKCMSPPHVRYPIQTFTFHISQMLDLPLL